MAAGTEMYRLLAMDLDKTLLRKDGSIPDETVKRLKELRSEGVHLALCTGRVRVSAEHYAEIIGGASVVSFNGSVIRTEDGKIMGSSIPPETVKNILEFCYENDVYIQFYDGDTILVEKHTPELDTDLDTHFTKYKECGDLRGINIKPTPKMVALELSDRVDGIMAEMREKFPQLTMTNSSRYVIEIMPRGVDKGYGLSIVADSLGISKEETVAVGDSMNDLAMIEWAGVGVAVSNADDRLKTAADIVTGKEMSLGVLEIADRLF